MPKYLNQIAKIFCIFIAISFSTENIAEEKHNKVLPKSTPGVTTIDVNQLLEFINSIPDLYMLDARIESSRKKGFIETSVNLPDIETNCDALSKIIPSKSDIAVFYCGSSSCGRSLNAVRIALQCGYKNLYWFRGGFKAWKNAGLPYIK